MSQVELSIVVPVYRGEQTVTLLLERIHATFVDSAHSIEVIFVEDCGGDDSWRVLAGLSSRYSYVRAVKLSKNFGQHAATLCGITLSKGRWVATIDDDLEQPPEYLPEMLKKASEGYALVYGVNQSRSHATWRNLTSDVGCRLFKFAIPSLNREYTSMRMIEGNLARELGRFQSPFTFIDGYLSWLTNDYATVLVPHDTRHAGRSNYSLRKLLGHMMNIFVTFSDLPLRLATWLGLAASIVGGTWGVAIVIGRMLGGISGGGYASIVAAVTFMGGLQLLILGIFGEYLARVNFRTGRMPLFLVARDTGRRL